MDLGFSVSATGLKEEYKKILEDSRDQIALAMPIVGQDLRDLLEKHIQKDVYDAYSPKVYPRRSENPEFGTPLDDMEANSTVVAEEDSVLLFYSPTGEHSGTLRDLPRPWYEDSDDLLFPHPLSGDALVQRIETGDGYDWTCGVGPRPFFQNFKDELESGKAEQMVTEALEKAKGVM